MTLNSIYCDLPPDIWTHFFITHLTSSRTVTVRFRTFYFALYSSTQRPLTPTITTITTITTLTTLPKPTTTMAFSLKKSSDKVSKTTSHTTVVDDAASIVSSAPSDITLIKEQNKTARASSPKTNPSATKADPNRSWEARARKSSFFWYSLRLF